MFSAVSTHTQLDLNLADWLNLSPSRVRPLSLSSNSLHSTTPQQPLFVTASPPAVPLPTRPFSHAEHPYSQSSDFLTCASSPADPARPRSDPATSSHSSFLSPNQNSDLSALHDLPSRQSTPQLFCVDSHTFDGISPLIRHFESSSTPVTTLCADEHSQSVRSDEHATPVPPTAQTTTHSDVKTKSKIDAASESESDPEPNRSFVDLLRAIPSPNTRGTTSASGSLNSPFRIAQPQPRLHTAPLISSSPLSLLVTPTPSRAVAGVLSGTSTPLEHSRPSSAASNAGRATPRRAFPPPPRRFAPSLLRVNLNHMAIAPAFADALAFKQRGPLEYEKEGHRYRTRARIRAGRAGALGAYGASGKGVGEVEEREREKREDLRKIRLALGKEVDDDEKDLEGDDVGKTKTEDRELHSLSGSPAPVARVKEIARAQSKAKSKSPSPAAARQQPRARRESARVKRSIREVDISEDEFERPTKKARSVGVKSKKVVEVETRPARAIRVPAVRPKGVPTPVLAVTPAKPVAKNVKSAESESAPEGEWNVTTPEQMTAPTGGIRASASTSTSDVTLATFGTRTFPEGVAVNPSFPLLYRRFPMCSFLDPTVERYVAPLSLYFLLLNLHRL